MPLGNTTSKLLGFAPKSHLTGISSAHCVLGVCAENCGGTQNWRDVVGQREKSASSAMQDQICTLLNLLSAQNKSTSNSNLSPTGRLVQGTSSDRRISFLNFWWKFILGLCQYDPVVSIACFLFFLEFTLWEFTHHVSHFLSIHAAFLHKQRSFPLFTTDRLSSTLDHSTSSFFPCSAWY